MIARMEERPKAFVVCDRCGHKLAERWERGGFNVIGTTRYRITPDWHAEFVCPSCGKRVRIDGRKIPA